MTQQLLTLFQQLKAKQIRAFQGAIGLPHRNARKEDSISKLTEYAEAIKKNGNDELLSILLDLVKLALKDEPIPKIEDYRLQKFESNSKLSDPYLQIFRRSHFYKVRKTIVPEDGYPHVTDTSPNNSKNTLRINFVLNNYEWRMIKDLGYKVYLFSGVFNEKDTAGTDFKVIYFPYPCSLECNGSKIKANTKGIKNKPGTTNPVDITDHVFQGKTNRLNIEFLEDKVVRFEFYLYLVEEVSVEHIERKVLDEPPIPKEDTLNLLKGDNDFELASETVSLTCPCSMVRIQTPVRSTSCKHVQCFDLFSFLKLQQHVPLWTCPICDIPILYKKKLRVDFFFKSLLESVSDKYDLVVLKPDGSYVPKVSEPKYMRVYSRTKPQESNSAKANSGNVKSENEIITKDINEVIDLTIEPQESNVIPLAIGELDNDSESVIVSRKRSKRSLPDEDFSSPAVTQKQPVDIIILDSDSEPEVELETQHPELPQVPTHVQPQPHKSYPLIGKRHIQHQASKITQPTLHDVISNISKKSASGANAKKTPPDMTPDQLVPNVPDQRLQQQEKAQDHQVAPVDHYGMISTGGISLTVTKVPEAHLNRSKQLKNEDFQQQLPKQQNQRDNLSAQPQAPNSRQKMPYHFPNETRVNVNEIIFSNKAIHDFNKRSIIECYKEINLVEKGIAEYHNLSLEVPSSLKNSMSDCLLSLTELQNVQSIFEIQTLRAYCARGIRKCKLLGGFLKSLTTEVIKHASFDYKIGFYVRLHRRSVYNNCMKYLLTWILNDLEKLIKLPSRSQTAQLKTFLAGLSSNYQNVNYKLKIAFKSCLVEVLESLKEFAFSGVQLSRREAEIVREFKAYISRFDNEFFGEPIMSCSHFEAVSKKLNEMKSQKIADQQFINPKCLDQLNCWIDDKLAIDLDSVSLNESIRITSDSLTKEKEWVLAQCLRNNDEPNSLNKNTNMGTTTGRAPEPFIVPQPQPLLSSPPVTVPVPLAEKTENIVRPLPAVQLPQHSQVAATSKSLSPPVHAFKSSKPVVNNATSQVFTSSLVTPHGIVNSSLGGKSISAQSAVPLASDIVPKLKLTTRPISHSQRDGSNNSNGDVSTIAKAVSKSSGSSEALDTTSDIVTKPDLKFPDNPLPLDSALKGANENSGNDNEIPKKAPANSSVVISDPPKLTSAVTPASGVSMRETAVVSKEVAPSALVSTSSGAAANLSLPTKHATASVSNKTVVASTPSLDHDPFSDDNDVPPMDLAPERPAEKEESIKNSNVAGKYQFKTVGSKSESTNTNTNSVVGTAPTSAPTAVVTSDSVLPQTTKGLSTLISSDGSSKPAVSAPPVIESLNIPLPPPSSPPPLSPKPARKKSKVSADNKKLSDNEGSDEAVSLTKDKSTTAMEESKIMGMNPLTGCHSKTISDAQLDFIMKKIEHNDTIKKLKNDDTLAKLGISNKGKENDVLGDLVRKVRENGISKVNKSVSTKKHVNSKNDSLANLSTKPDELIEMKESEVTQKSVDTGIASKANRNKDDDEGKSINKELLPPPPPPPPPSTDLSTPKSKLSSLPLLPPPQYTPPPPPKQPSIKKKVSFASSISFKPWSGPNAEGLKTLVEEGKKRKSMHGRPGGAKRVKQ